MEEVWLQAIKEAMNAQGVCEEVLAEALHMRVESLHLILNGQERLSFSELSDIVSVLKLDINRIMELDDYELDLELCDETEIILNRLAREIPKERRNEFLRAVQIIMDCLNHRT